MARKISKTAKRSKHRDLSTPLFPYFEKANADHCKQFGTKVFGSYSAYLNTLVAKDRGLKRAKLGTRGSLGGKRA